MSDGYDGLEGPFESPEEYVSRLTEERRVALENSRQEREIESAIEDLNKLWHTIAIHTFTDKIFDYIRVIASVDKIFRTDNFVLDDLNRASSKKLPFIIDNTQYYNLAKTVNDAGNQYFLYRKPPIEIEGSDALAYLVCKLANPKLLSFDTGTKLFYRTGRELPKLSQLPKVKDTKSKLKWYKRLLDRIFFWKKNSD